MTTRNTLSLLLLLAPGLLPAQQLNVNNNTYLVVSGPTSLVLNNTSLACYGTLVPDTGTVVFTGDSSRGATITGNAPRFHNLTISRSSGNVTISSYACYVKGALTMNSGNLSLGALTFLNLGTTGVIAGEKDQSRVVGAGYLTSTATLNAPMQANPGNLGLLLASAANLGTISVWRKQVASTLPYGSPGISRVYSLHNTTDSFPANTIYDIGFHYLDAELNNVYEPSLNIWFYRNNTWTAFGRNSLDMTANLVTRYGFNQPGSFTLGYSPLEMRKPGDEEPKGGKVAGDEEPKHKATGTILYPNPAHDHCTLSVTAAGDINDIIGLYNASGTVLQQKQVQLRAGANSIDWDMSRLPAGIYYLRSANNAFKSIMISRL